MKTTLLPARDAWLLLFNEPNIPNSITESFCNDFIETRLNAVLIVAKKFVDGCYMNATTEIEETQILANMVLVLISLHASWQRKDYVSKTDLNGTFLNVSDYLSAPPYDLVDILEYAETNVLISKHHSSNIQEQYYYLTFWGESRIRKIMPYLVSSTVLPTEFTLLLENEKIEQQTGMQEQNAPSKQSDESEFPNQQSEPPNVDAQYIAEHIKRLSGYREPQTETPTGKMLSDKSVGRSEQKPQQQTKRGRPLDPRSAWVLERHANQISKQDIFDDWNGKTTAERKAIDPKKFHQFRSVKDVAEILRRPNRKKGGEMVKLT